VRHLAYLVGWGFGTANEPRPELVRISLPGDPITFDENHYFAAGDRRDPVLACAPAGDADGPQGILDVWKRSETHAIHGYDRATFGIRLIDPRHGIVASRAHVNIEGLNIAWAEEGPRLWSGLGVSDALELPLGLDDWEPDDLVDEGELAYAFAHYVPRERVGWFHFGRRVYALTARVQGHWRWSYQTLGFDAYGAITLFETTEEKTAPPGYPSCDEVTPAGSFADILVGNHNQDGDETLEVWLRLTPLSGGWEKTASGKLAAYIHDSGTDPFVLTDWTSVGNSSFDLGPSGELRFQHDNAAANFQGVLHTAVAARAKAMVQTIMRMNAFGGATTNASMGVGVIGAGVTPTTWDFYIKRKTCGPVAASEFYTVGRVLDGVFSTLDNVDGAQAVYDVYRKMVVWADASPGTEPARQLEGWNGLDDVVLPRTTVNMSLVSGQAVIARFQNSQVSSVTVEEFYYHTDKFIAAVGDLVDGWKVKLLGAADVVLLEEEVSGGSALLDCMGLWMPDVLAVQLTDAADLEIDRTSPAEGVWGGDTYTFTAAAASDWFLSRSVAVSASASQLVQVIELLIASSYEVALRYRRGLLYSAGAEDTDNPQTWPSVSRCSFTTTIDPPVVESGVWSRESAVLERVRLSIEPVVGAEDEDIEVWRAPEVGGAPGVYVLLDTILGPHASPFNYDDETIAGETAYYYAALTSSVAGESPLSEPVRVWAGPAAIPQVVGVFFQGGAYIIGFTTTDATLETELYDQLDTGPPPVNTGFFALRETVAAGETEAGSGAGVFDEEDDVEFLARLRHKLTSFAVSDFGEYSENVLVDWPEGL
jgi:hypothetical protein